MRFRILKLDSLYSSLIVQISGVLIVRDRFREACLHDEVAGLLVQVLLEISANDDVHCGSLTNLILMQTAILVGLKDERADRAQNSKLLVRDRDEVNRLCSE